MRRAFILAVAALLLGGCQLPGGEPTGPAYAVSAEFADVLDLVPQAAVKVNDVTVGSVSGIELHGWAAIVHMRVRQDVRLPDNATAAIRQSSLLGEKFVALAAPGDEAPQGSLGDGDLITLAHTDRGAEVEEVLAALGLLLNGGGLAQLKTINAEVAKALAGRETDAKAALHQLDAFITGLDKQKDDIVRAIEALDRLAARLAEQRDTIGRAIDALDPGITVLAQQREQFTAALVALRDLSAVGQRVINASRDDTIASLRALQPTLDQLVKAGDALPKAIDFGLTYPFPPNVQKAISGDFVRLHITADLDATTILANTLAKGGGPTTLPPLPQVPLPSLPPIPLPSLPPLPLPSVPPLPLPSVLPSGILPSGLLPLPSLPGVHFGEADPATGEISGVRGGFEAILTGAEPLSGAGSWR
jgi:phospholipid/cholesterol/gamma-HCH transport system substrate-binding protein